MRRIVKVDVYRMHESCERTTFFVRLTTDEGFTMDPDSFASHCIYDDMNGTVGLPVKEARDRALTTAHEWADFLQLEVTPYVEEDVLYEPMMTFDTYTMQREEEAEDAAALAAPRSPEPTSRLAAPPTRLALLVVAAVGIAALGFRRGMRS